MECRQLVHGGAKVSVPCGTAYRRIHNRASRFTRKISCDRVFRTFLEALNGLVCPPLPRDRKTRVFRQAVSVLACRQMAAGDTTACSTPMSMTRRPGDTYWCRRGV